MRLIRRDPSPKKDEWPDDLSQEEFGVQKAEDFELDSEGATITVDFKRFGRGTERRSDLAVEVCWIDVQSFVRAFIEMEHLDALVLYNMIRLAQKIEQAGWTPSDPPTEDFEDILPTKLRHG